MKIANVTERSDLHHRLVYSTENVSVLMKKNPPQNQDQRSKTHGVEDIKQNLNKAYSLATPPPPPMIFQTKKQPLKNPRSRAYELGGVVIKQNLKKSAGVRPTTSRPLQQMKKQTPPKKNMAEMLELFHIAKKSADVANAKGILVAKEETCICVETLSLLISYPISSTAKETRLVMEKLHRLTKHKDRKICNSALNLHQHWTLSIRDQQS